MSDNYDKITFLYTNIGRGHPFYLDGIIDSIVRQGNVKYVRNRTDVFQISKGISLLGWKLIKWLYFSGSQDGIISKLYSIIRKQNDYNQPGFLIKILGRDIRKKFSSSNNPLVVAHPLLVGILKGRGNIYYQHGEVVTPSEAVVGGLDKVFVPTKEAAQPFYEFGYDNDKILITGLCIEPAQVKQANDAFENRTVRYNKSQPLTGAFFLSGAEPKAHLNRLLKAVKSVMDNRGESILFAKVGGMLHKSFIRKFDKAKSTYSYIDSSELIPHDLPQILLVGYKTRKELDAFTARLFNYFDYLVSPSHERTNWALGLGLPMFILEPPIGPFSPLNREFLIKNRVAMTISSDFEADNFGRDIVQLQETGELEKMANNGWGKYHINGFQKITEFFNNYFE